MNDDIDRPAQDAEVTPPDEPERTGMLMTAAVIIISVFGFLGKLMGEDDPARRLEGSLAAVARAAQEGVQILRVHDVGPTRRFLDAWMPMHSRPVPSVAEEVSA